MDDDVQTVHEILALNLKEQGFFLGELREMGTQNRLEYENSWHYWARPEQLAPVGDWTVWLVMAGRGFGKTRAGAEWVRNIAEADGSARFALIGANFAETRMVMVEGESGLLSIAPPKNRPIWEPSLKRLRWSNGAEAYLYSAAEPEGLRGPQHSHSWCDEIAKWANNSGQALAAWDNLKMGLRLGLAPKIAATTTPRPVALVRALVKGDYRKKGVVINQPVELFVLRPDRITIEPDEKGWPAAYAYRAGEHQTRFAAQDAMGRPAIIHIKAFHPTDDHYGLGCLGAAAKAVAVHNAAAQWNKALLDNAARPSGALVFDPGPDGSALSADQFDRLPYRKPETLCRMQRGQWTMAAR